MQNFFQTSFSKVNARSPVLARILRNTSPMRKKEERSLKVGVSLASVRTIKDRR